MYYVGCLSKYTGLAKRSFPGLVNFVPADAYHFCLSLPAAFSKHLTWERPYIEAPYIKHCLN